MTKEQKVCKTIKFLVLFGVTLLRNPLKYSSEHQEKTKLMYSYLFILQTPQQYVQDLQQQKHTLTFFHCEKHVSPVKEFFQMPKNIAYPNFVS